MARRGHRDFDGTPPPRFSAGPRLFHKMSCPLLQSASQTTKPHVVLVSKGASQKLKAAGSGRTVFHAQPLHARRHKTDVGKRVPFEAGGMFVTSFAPTHYVMRSCKLPKTNKRKSKSRI